MSEPYKKLIIAVDELWLKGSNKHLFTKALRKNIRRALKEFPDTGHSYAVEGPKHIIRFEKPISKDIILRLTKVTGISHITPVIEVPLNLEEAKQRVKELIAPVVESFSTMRVVTKRSNKKFPTDSMTTSKEIGAAILQVGSHLKVTMKNPQLEVRVQILADHMYLSYEKFSGFGGLPVSTAGKMVTLLSGGIDSPVASFMMAKRGVEQTLLFFHAYPFVGDEVVEKIIRLSRKVKPYLRYGPLNIIPFGNFQQKITQLCPDGYQTLFFRIYMVQIAQAFAKHINHIGIITGDALSQVSSQTLENIRAIDHCGRDITILRPLIGMNKIEIQNIAKQIDTFDTSIEPHDDACSMLAPKSPVLNASLETCDRFLKDYPMMDEMIECLKGTKRVVKNEKGEVTYLSSYQDVDFSKYF